MIPKLEQIANARPYAPQAYELVLRGLNHLVEDMAEPSHVRGDQLAEGIRRYALDEFGPMAKHVLNSWGVRRTRDFGEIVFHLVEGGLLRKTEDDCIEDFDDCYDFQRVFETDYFERHAKFEL